MRDWINLMEYISLDDLGVDRKAIVDGVFEYMDWSSGSGESCIQDYARQNDIELENDEWGEPFSSSKEVDINTPEFKEWFARWVEDNYGEAEWDILNRVRDHKLTLWRCITAPRDWKPEGRHPGIYWSYLETAAEAHWGSFGGEDIKWTMQTTVPLEAINWEQTLIMNAQPDYQDEKEIRLREDFPVAIDKYWSE